MNPIVDIFRDLWGYIKATKNIYIALFIAFLLLIGAVVILTEGTAVMPFIYTIF